MTHCVCFQVRCEFSPQTTHKTPDIDLDRFYTEAEYRKDSLLGMVLSSDSDAFNCALHEASKYEVDERLLAAENLEFLLTDSGCEYCLVAKVKFNKPSD